MAAVEMCYASCGCNRTPHCIDWGKNGLICYGSCRSVALYKPEVRFSKQVRLSLKLGGVIVGDNTGPRRTKVITARGTGPVGEIFFPEEFRPSHYLVW